MSAPGRFRSALRHVLLNDMLRKVKPKGANWKVLVVDREALRILAAALPLTELVNEGVTIVEMLDLRREPLPRLPAIFFITPTAESIAQFAQEDKAQYREFHLFFTGRLPDYQLDVIRSNKPLLKRVRSLVELNISFLAYESRLFSLDRPAASLPHLFGNEGGLSHQDAVSEMTKVSERLTDACVLMGADVPWTVRCDTTSHVSRTVSSLVKEQLETLRIDRMHSKSPDKDDAPPPGSPRASPPKKATLIILDRATDVISPLIHEFSYQAMVHDLVQLDYRKPGGAHYTDRDNVDKKGKPTNLPIDDEDQDPVWKMIRHLFFEQAASVAASKLKDFLENDPAFRIQKKDQSEIEIEEMTKAVRGLKQSQNLRDRYAMHVHALTDCRNLCASYKVPDLALVEQDLAMGMHADGTRVSSKTVADSLLQVLHNTAIPIEHRVRTLLIALAIATEDNLWMDGEASLLVQSSQFKDRMRDSRLLNLPGQRRDLVCSIHGLREILTFTKSSSEPKGVEGNSHAARLRTKMKEKKAYKQAEKNAARKKRRQMLDDTEELPFDVARYNPPCRAILADLVSDTLDESDFPVVGAVNVDDIIANVMKGYANVSEEPASAARKDPSKDGVISRGKDAFQALKHKGSSHADELVVPPENADPDHLYMVFFVGGVCYSEVRAVYEVCDKRGANIIVGGSHVLTPMMFLNALGGIADAALKIKVLLPPLPIDLAATRQARTKEVAAMKAQAQDEKKKKAAAEKTAAAAAPSSSPDSVRKGSSPNNNYNDDGFEKRPADAEVVTVESYKKPSKFKRFFGKK